MLPALYIQGNYPYDVQKELESIFIVETTHDLELLKRALASAKRRKNPVAVDTETDNCDPKKQTPIGHAVMVTMQLAWLDCDDMTATEACVNGDATFHRYLQKAWINVRENPTFIDELRDWIGDENAPKVLHNSAYDEHVFMNHGVRLKGILADTLQMSRERYQELPTHSLDGELGLVRTLFGEKRLTTLQALGVFKKLKNGEDGKSIMYLSMGEYVDDEEMRPYQITYSVYDVADTIRLYYVLREKLRQMEWRDSPDGLYEYCETESMDLLSDLRDMERRGAPVDIDMAEMLVKTNYERLVTLSEELYGEVGQAFSIGSNPQKAWLLYGVGLREFKRESAPLVFDEEGDQSIADFLETKRRKKSKNETFIIDGMGLPCQEEAAGKDPWVKSKNYKGKMSSGYPSADKEALEWTLEQLTDVHPEDVEAAERGSRIIRLIQQYQKLSTLVSGTLMALQTKNQGSNASGIATQNDGVTRYIHGGFSPKARTGRLTAEKPNLQNVPVHGKDGKLIRHAFCAPPGDAVIVCDFSQLELNVLSWYLAELFGDLSYANILRTSDVHENTAKEIGEPRSTGKRVNFGLIYGMTEYKLAADLGISVARAREIWKKYFLAYPQIDAFLTWAVDFGREFGYCRTLGGRYRPLPFITEMRKNRPSSRARSDERRAKNTPIQGSAADIVAKAMHIVNTDKVLKDLGYVLRIQVHDELVGTCPAKNREKALVRKTYLMENAVTFPQYEGLIQFPVEGHWGATWADAKDGKLFTCFACLGTGKDKDPDIEKCTHCGGKGELSLKGAEEMFEEGLERFKYVY